MDDVEQRDRVMDFWAASKCANPHVSQRTIPCHRRRPSQIIGHLSHRPRAHRRLSCVKIHRTVRHCNDKWIPDVWLGKLVNRTHSNSLTFSNRAQSQLRHFRPKRFSYYHCWSSNKIYCYSVDFSLLAVYRCRPLPLPISKAARVDRLHLWEHKQNTHTCVRTHARKQSQ